MTVSEKAFSAWPDVHAKLEVTTESQPSGQNKSVLRIKLTAFEVDQQIAHASGIYAPDWKVTVAGQEWSGTWAYDYRPSGLQSYTILNVTKTITHNAAGEASVSATAWFEDSVLGTAAPSLTHVPADIQRVPGAPTPVSITEITPSSFVYHFTGTSDGGSPVLEWQVGYGTGLAATHTQQADGTDTVSGLLPDTTYSVWSRGRNANGWGPWSARMEVTTKLAGVRVKHGGAWKNAVPFAKVDGVWKQVIPFIKHGGAWKSGI